MSDTPEEPTEHPQTDPSGSDGGRKIRTAVGLGGSGNGNWDGPLDQSDAFSPGGPIRHQHLKDIAVVALAATKTRDYTNIRTCIAGQLSSTNFERAELADALAVMILTAYTVAQHSPTAMVLDDLQSACPYFSKQQLLRIRELANRTTES